MAGLGERVRNKTGKKHYYIEDSLVANGKGLAKI